MATRPIPPLRRFPERDRPSLVVRWGVWAVVGMALVLVATFVELSQELSDSGEEPTRLLGMDTAVLRFIALHRRPWLNGIAMDLTALGSPLVVALFTFAFGALLLATCDRRGATVLVVSSLAAALLTTVTKTILERPRPEVVPKLVEVTGLSYPSGHSLASAAVYLTAAFVLGRHVARRGDRVGAVMFVATVVLLIGASRVYLGVHFPSDVLGGILLGTAWALLMAAVLHRLDRCAAGSTPNGTDGGAVSVGSAMPVRPACEAHPSHLQLTGRKQIANGPRHRGKASRASSVVMNSSTFTGFVKYR